MTLEQFIESRSRTPVQLKDPAIRRSRFLMLCSDSELHFFMVTLGDEDSVTADEIRREIEIRKNEPSSTQKDIQAPLSSGCSLSED
jgi:hypothetical protein